MPLEYIVLHRGIANGANVAGQREHEAVRTLEAGLLESGQEPIELKLEGKLLHPKVIEPVIQRKDIVDIKAKRIDRKPGFKAHALGEELIGGNRISEARPKGAGGGDAELQSVAS